MTFYPDLNQELDVALDLAKQDENYLLSPECPYSEKTKVVFTLLVDEVEVDEDDGDDSKWSKLERETQRLYKDLKKTSKELTGDDHAEKMSYFRTATSLLDKIVGLQERAVGLKQISVFQQTVIDIMEDVCDAGQRTEVMARLKSAIEGN